LGVEQLISNFSNLGICSQPFDSHYQQSCSDDGVYAQYYYYDQTTKSCRTFWYGNCKGKSENIFATMETCQWVCERKRERKIPSKIQIQKNNKIEKI
jgi:hypothetical protein